MTTTTSSVPVPKFYAVRHGSRFVRLRESVSTTLESARDHYDAYGWHLPASTGDVPLQAVPYGTAPDQADAMLRRDYPSLGISERADLIDQAAAISRWARDVEAAQTAAVQSDDPTSVVAALEEAAATEAEGGDHPSTWALASQLLQRVDVGVAVFVDSAYLGLAESEAEAERWVTAFLDGEIVADSVPEKAELGKVVREWEVRGPDATHSVRIIACVLPMD